MRCCGHLRRSEGEPLGIVELAVGVRGIDELLHNRLVELGRCAVGSMRARGPFLQRALRAVLHPRQPLRIRQAAPRMFEASGLKAVRRLDTCRGERCRPRRSIPRRPRGPGRSTLGPPFWELRMVLQAEFGKLVRPHFGTDGEALHLPVLGAPGPR